MAKLFSRPALCSAVSPVAASTAAMSTFLFSSQAATRDALNCGCERRTRGGSTGGEGLRGEVRGERGRAACGPLGDDPSVARDYVIMYLSSHVQWPAAAVAPHLHICRGSEQREMRGDVMHTQRASRQR